MTLKALAHLSNLPLPTLGTSSSVAASLVRLLSYLREFPLTVCSSHVSARICRQLRESASQAEACRTCPCTRTQLETEDCCSRYVFSARSCTIRLTRIRTAAVVPAAPLQPNLKFAAPAVVAAPVNPKVVSVPVVDKAGTLKAICSESEVI